MKYPGGQSSDSVRDDRELTLLTESEFCPPEHYQHAGCAIKSDLYILIEKGLPDFPQS